MDTRSFLFKLFPPPTFLVMPHAGLDISDEAIRCIEYRRTSKGLVISKHATQQLPPGLVDGGDIKDEKAFVDVLKQFVSKNNLSYVKVSLPEEKAYLFQTEVPTADFRSIAQNIEFKLDQNVPLSAADAIFQFDLMPRAVTGDVLRASVSVVPRTYVEHHVALLKEAGVSTVAFEVAPKAIVTAYEPPHSEGTHLIVHIMKKKSGLYIVSEGVVCFTSTIAWGSDSLGDAPVAGAGDALMAEIGRVHAYWMTRTDARARISEIVVVGSRAEACESIIRNQGSDIIAHTVLPDVWHNAFDVNSYVPPITKTESLEYVIAAGLALISPIA
ncbi:MAG: pilus assembly protein PilM [Patescibacteria group bacterium]